MSEGRQESLSCKKIAEDKIAKSIAERINAIVTRFF